MTRSLLILFSAALSITALHAAEKPNIVVILADDIGLGDLSFQAREIRKKKALFETPNLDALAAQSLWFTDGHSPAALCAPSRYAIMSGNNNYRSYAPPGVWSTFGPTAFKKGEVTLGSIIRDAGYRTGFIGKWHLGGDFYKRGTREIHRGEKGGDILGQVDLTHWAGSGPKYCGFDYDFTSPCGIQGPLYLLYENEKWHPWAAGSEIIALNARTAKRPVDLASKGEGPGDSNWDARELGGKFASKAAEFITKSRAEEKPFFLYYCASSVHEPHCPPNTIDGQKVKGTTPTAHLDMVVALDLEVGRIVKAVKEAGQFENTLFVFTSDNGGLQDPVAKKLGYDPSGGWSGSKGGPLEGGHRVPFFFVWPGHIKPGISAELITGQDIIATCAAVVGSSIPAGQAQDSNNLLGLLTGKGGFQPREYWMHQAGAHQEVMLRRSPWKLVIQSNFKRTSFKPKALYNLTTDPGEKQNLFDDPEHAPRVKQMLDEYLEIMKSGKPTVTRSAPN